MSVFGLSAISILVACTLIFLHNLFKTFNHQGACNSRGVLVLPREASGCVYLHLQYMQICKLSKQGLLYTFHHTSVPKRLHAEHTQFAFILPRKILLEEL